MANNWDESIDAFEYWYEDGGLEKVKHQMPTIFQKHPELLNAAAALEAARIGFEAVARYVLPDHEVTDD